MDWEKYMTSNYSRNGAGLGSVDSINDNLIKLQGGSGVGNNAMTSATALSPDQVAPSNDTMFKDWNTPEFLKSMGSGISDMFDNSDGGMSSAMQLGSLGLGAFSTYDKYKTNKLNRALVNQQIANNNTIMADNAWNKNKLGTGFGVANYGS